jgi:hypothetical protein
MKAVYNLKVGNYFVYMVTFSMILSFTFTGIFRMEYGPHPKGKEVPLLFTDNETNYMKLYGVKNRSKYQKDAFHDYVINGL